jgi:hypothetical protein
MDPCDALYHIWKHMEFFYILICLIHLQEADDVDDEETLSYDGETLSWKKWFSL